MILLSGYWLTSLKLVDTLEHHGRAAAACEALSPMAPATAEAASNNNVDRSFIAISPFAQWAGAFEDPNSKARGLQHRTMSVPNEESSLRSSTMMRQREEHALTVN